MKRLLVLLVAILIATPAIAEANLLVNPGFEQSGEQGYTTGWTNEWNNNIFGTTDNPHSGTRAARNFWDGGMYQNVAITEGLAYRLTGWAFIPTGEGGSPWGTYIGMKFLNEFGATLDQVQIDMQDLPREVYNIADTGFITAPEGAVTAQVRFGTWASAPYKPVRPTDFDDFDLQAVPEPSSLMLLATGITGLLGFGFRRKR